MLLAGLAIAGAIVEYPLAFVLKSLDRSDLVRALPFLGVTMVMAALIPLSVRLSAELGLPGAPLIAAKLAGEKLHFSIRSLLRVSLGYAFLAAVAGASVLANPQMRRRLENALVFSNFTPATTFGQPMMSKMRLWFHSSRIDVRG